MINVHAPLPDDFYHRLPGRTAVLEQSIRVDASRWVEACARSSAAVLRGPRTRRPQDARPRVESHPERPDRGHAAHGIGNHRDAHADPLGYPGQIFCHAATRKPLRPGSRARR